MQQQYNIYEKQKTERHKQLKILDPVYTWRTFTGVKMKNNWINTLG